MVRIHKMILGGLDLRRYPLPRGYLCSFVLHIFTTVWEFVYLYYYQYVESMFISPVDGLMPCQDFVISYHIRDSVLNHSLFPGPCLTPFPHVSPRTHVNGA